MFTPIMPLNIDSTMITCWRACPQKFYKEFILGLRPPGVSIDLHAGGCFAGAIEEVYKWIYIHNADFETALMRAQARFMIEWGNFQIPEWKKTPKTQDRVWEAVETYFRTYPVHTDPVKPYIAVDGRPTMEYTFAIPLEPIGEDHFPEHPSGGPWLYSGRFDMLGSKNGFPVVRDEKTTTSIGANWAKQWQLRNQFIGYCWACQIAGIPVDTVIIRGIGILKGTINHVESEQTYTQELIGRWLDQLRRDLWTIRRQWDEGYWDFNFAEACSSYGSCIFMDSCTSASPDSWLADMEVRRWNPLEKNPVKIEGPLSTQGVAA